MSDRRAFRQQQYDTTGQLVSTGSANAYVVRGARPVTGYSAGLFLTFFPNFTNTGAATLAYGDLGAKSIKKTGSASDLASGDIVSGNAAQVLFDATNDCWQLLNPISSHDSERLAGRLPSSSGDRWGVVPFVHTDGVMDIGRYIDFHNSDADTTDNANRLDTNGGTTGLYETPSGGSLKRIVSLINSTLASGDIIYFDGTNFVRLAKGTNGDALTLASGLPSWSAAAASAWTTVKKTTDESTSSDTTLSNDSALSFSMAANTKYSIRIKVYWFVASTVSGFKFGLAGPASPTSVTVASKWVASSALTTLNTQVDNTYPSGIGMTSASSGNPHGYVEIDAMVQNGANSGTFAFQWAQNSSSAISLSVLAGSYLEYS